MNATPKHTTSCSMTKTRKTKHIRFIRWFGARLPVSLTVEIVAICFCPALSVFLIKRKYLKTKHSLCQYMLAHTQLEMDWLASVSIKSYNSMCNSGLTKIDFGRCRIWPFWSGAAGNAPKIMNNTLLMLLSNAVVFRNVMKSFTNNAQRRRKKHNAVIKCGATAAGAKTTARKTCHEIKK